METKTRAELNRGKFIRELQSYLSPLTPEDKLIEIDFLINNTIKDERDDISTQIIKLKKAEKEALKKAEITQDKSISKDINSFSIFDNFLKSKEGDLKSKEGDKSKGGYKKTIRTRKNIKKNNKSFRRKSNKIVKYKRVKSN
jgi:hypothetical protein